MAKDSDKEGCMKKARVLTVMVLLLGAARELYPDCDYVIDIMAEQRIITTIVFFVFKIEKLTWVMRGTAIKYIQ